MFDHEGVQAGGVRDAEHPSSQGIDADARAGHRVLAAVRQPLQGEEKLPDRKEGELLRSLLLSPRVRLRVQSCCGGSRRM